MKRFRLSLLFIIICSFAELQAQRLPHTYSNGLTLISCEMERCYEIFPTVPRRNVIKLAMPGLGIYFGYYKCMEDEKANISYSASDFVKWDEFPTEGTEYVRGIVYYDEDDNSFPVIMGVPGPIWDTIEPQDLTGSWTEIEPYSMRWFGIDENHIVSKLTEHTYTFSNGKVCKESYKGYMEGCAEQRVGDSYNRHSHSWSRTVKGGYYFKVFSNLTNTYNFSFETPTTIVMKCSSSTGIAMDVQPVINNNEYEESYRKQAIQQIKKDLSSNADVKNAKKNHKDWFERKRFPQTQGNSTKYIICKLNDDLIVLFPLVDNNNPTKDWNHYIILQRKE